MIIPTRQNLLSHRHIKSNSMSKIFPEPSTFTLTKIPLKSRYQRDQKLMNPKDFHTAACLEKEEKSYLPAIK